MEGGDRVGGNLAPWPLGGIDAPGDIIVTFASQFSDVHRPVRRYTSVVLLLHRTGRLQKDFIARW